MLMSQSSDNGSQETENLDLDQNQLSHLHGDFKYRQRSRGWFAFQSYEEMNLHFALATHNYFLKLTKNKQDIGQLQEGKQIWNQSCCKSPEITV